MCDFNRRQNWSKHSTFKWSLFSFQWPSKISDILSMLSAEILNSKKTKPIDTTKQVQCMYGKVVKGLSISLKSVVKACNRDLQLQWNSNSNLTLLYTAVLVLMEQHEQTFFRKRCIFMTFCCNTHRSIKPKLGARQLVIKTPVSKINLITPVAQHYLWVS